MHVDGIRPTVTFIRTTQGNCIAAFLTQKWKISGCVKDSQCMLLNLTDRYIAKARDNENGGINCNQSYGPSFGLLELAAEEPLLG